LFFDVGSQTTRDERRFRSWLRCFQNLALVTQSPAASLASLRMSQDRALALRIVGTLSRAGFTALFAGGCVRDELMGRTPSDYDVATNATPEQISKLFARTAHVGAHFGVVLVRDGPRTVEVATFRSDGVYEDARRPTSVRFSSPREDAQRRDFTVNALFFEPKEFAHDATAAWREGARIESRLDGNVIDFVGGLADMQVSVLRAVGDAHARLAEDHLRALRAVRLAAKLSFSIEEATKAAIRRHAMELRGVSPERIGDECRQMFEHPTRAAAADLLSELGLVAAMLGTPHRDMMKRESTLLAKFVTAGERASVGAAIIAWSHGLGVQLLPTEAGSSAKQFIVAARDGLCLSNDETSEMTHIVQRLGELASEWKSATVARQKRILQSKEVESALAMLRVLDADHARSIDSQSQILARTPSGLKPQPLLTGDHLIAAGAKPGPQFKRVLDAVYDAQLEDRITTPEAALALGIKLMGSL
jgi:poly(A) polymerase